MADSKVVAAVAQAVLFKEQGPLRVWGVQPYACLEWVATVLYRPVLFCKGLA